MTTGRKLLQGNSRVETMYAMIHEPLRRAHIRPRWWPLAAAGTAALLFAAAMWGPATEPETPDMLAIVSVLSPAEGAEPFPHGRPTASPSPMRRSPTPDVSASASTLGPRRRLTSPPSGLWLSLILQGFKATRFVWSRKTASVMSVWSWINRPRRRSTEVVTRKMTRGCGRHAIKTAQ